MTNRVDIYTNGWDDYELLDTGAGRKLERFATVVLDRPDPQAIWNRTQQNLWERANAVFSWTQTKQRWKEKKDTPHSWIVTYDDVRMLLSFKQLKHIGIFPEHAPQWKEIATHSGEANTRVLNLFGYTGAASLVAMKAGAFVTHVDASKQAINAVRENIKLSNLQPDSIRLICEDAIKYTKRLVGRGEQFEIIVMDPPAFGRGPKGEVWKIEEKLSELLLLIPKLLSPKAKLVVLNGYAAGYAARSFAELLSDAMKERAGSITYGDIGIRQNRSNRILSTGIYAQWNA